MGILPKPVLGTDALVLRTWPCGETSAIASLLTRERGYVRVMAKGARGPRSRLRSLIEPGRLAAVEMSWDPERELQYLRAGSVLLDPLAVDASLERNAYLLGALELTDRCRPSGGPSAGETAVAVFAVCEEFLRVLSCPTCRDAAHLFFAFEWELLSRHGLAPEIEICVGCGLDPTGEAGAVLRFHPAEGGMVCANCATGGRILGREARAAMLQLSQSGLAVSVREPLSAPVRREVGGHLHRFLGYNLPGYRLPAALDLLRIGKESGR